MRGAIGWRRAAELGCWFWRPGVSRTNEGSACRPVVFIRRVRTRSGATAVQITEYRDGRQQIAAACFSHARCHGDLTLVLYDVTTLYFEAENEDELRNVGYSKERRVDPQIVVGLLVDRGGFPLGMGSFEGNKAETTTILPLVCGFQQRHDPTDMIVVADAGMFSAANLALRSWRAVWAYSHKRALWDRRTLALHEQRASAVVADEQSTRTPRFVKTTAAGRCLDEASLARAQMLVGLKGYVTNIPVDAMDPETVIASYHDLWHIKQSFRMSKTDLAARPMFVRTRDAIEAHLTVVFAALAVSRQIQRRTGLSTRNICRQLRPLQSATIAINGATQTFPPAIPADQQAVLDAIASGHELAHEQHVLTQERSTRRMPR